MAGGSVFKRKQFALVALFLIIALIATPLVYQEKVSDYTNNDNFFLFELPTIKEIQNKASLARSEFISKVEYEGGS